MTTTLRKLYCRWFGHDMRIHTDNHLRCTRCPYDYTAQVLVLRPDLEV